VSHLDLQHTTISNFERSAQWSPHTDKIVAAYAALCDVAPAALWQAAIDVPETEP